MWSGFRLGVLPFCAVACLQWLMTHGVRPPVFNTYIEACGVLQRSFDDFATVCLHVLLL